MVREIIPESRAISVGIRSRRPYGNRPPPAVKEALEFRISEAAAAGSDGRIFDGAWIIDDNANPIGGKTGHGYVRRTAP